MTEVEYRREMNRNYMVIRPEMAGSEKYTIRMLSGNQIQGLLPFQDKIVNGEVRYYYDITSKQPLNRILEHRTMSGSELRILLTELLFTLRQMERFLLDEGQLCFQPEYIYVEPGSFKASFCLVPGIRKDFAQEFCELSQYFLDHVSHSDGDAVVLAFSIFKECRKLNFGIDDVEQCLRQQNGGSETKETEDRKIGVLEDHAERADPYRNEGFKPTGETNRVRKKEQDMDDEEFEVSVRYFLASAIGLGMVLIPVVLYFICGLFWLYQWKWILLVGEIAAVLMLVMIIKGKDSDEKENGTRMVSSKHIWKFEKNQRTDHEKKEEPWEIYFQEEEREEHSKDTIYESQSSFMNWEEIVNETKVKEEDEIQTVLLSARPLYKECRKLVPMGGGSEIPLKYFPFIIGKNRDLTDYCLNCPGVSRLHVKLEETANGYTVTDLNSTNGTMVNGVILEANGASPIAIGDELTIGAERYYFR